jgi:hypothetical protein
MNPRTLRYHLHNFEQWMYNEYSAHVYCIEYTAHKYIDETIQVWFMSGANC